MLSKLVSCQPGASRELDLRAQGLKSSKCSKLIFGNIIVVRYGSTPPKMYPKFQT